MKSLRLFNSVLLLASVQWVAAEVTITGQPKNASVSLGATAQFTVTATSTSPAITYQWRFNDLPLEVGANPSAATSRLSLTNVTLASGGPYSVVVSDTSGSVTSQVATLTIDPTFTKITTGLLVMDLEPSTSATWIDYDQDGNLDLFVGNAINVRNSLYHNNGDGSFSKITNSLTILNGRAWGVGWGDYDNDGLPDLIVANAGGSLNDYLFHNDGGGQFTQIKGSPVVQDKLDSTQPLWGDYDNDGLIDLFVSRGYYSGAQYDRLFHNEGGGVFRAVTVAEAGDLVGTKARSLAYGWTDFDNDGILDLFLAYTATAGNHATNFVFHNSLQGPFERVPQPVLDVAGQSWEHSWGDYDNDGYLDVFMPASGGTNGLFHNVQGQGFADVSASSGLRQAMASQSSAWGDFDNDGWLDLCVGNYDNTAHYPGGNVLYRNNHDGTFTRLNIGSLTREGGRACAVVWGDYDNDGFLDLYIANGDENNPQRNYLYRNNGNGNHWLKIQLAGTRSNRLGIGAKVRIQATISNQSIQQFRPISGQHSWIGDNGLIAHFGLGDATNVMTLRIEWPSGTVQELANVTSKQFLTIWEPPALRGAALADGSCLLTVTAEPNRAWRIQASTNLQTWQTVKTVTNPQATFQYTDAAEDANGWRFYRVAAE